jgi:hypothetical protein
MSALDMFSRQIKISRTNESELKTKLEKGVVGGLKVKREAHALSSTQ